MYVRRFPSFLFLTRLLKRNCVSCEWRANCSQIEKQRLRLLEALAAQKFSACSIEYQHIGIEGKLTENK